MAQKTQEWQGAQAASREEPSLLLDPPKSGLLPSLGGAGTHSLYRQSCCGREAETEGDRKQREAPVPTRRRCSLIYLEHFSLTRRLVGLLLTALLSVVLALPLRPDFRGPPLELPATLSTFS